MVTIGKSWCRPSNVELHPDQPILSSTMSHCPMAAYEPRGGRGVGNKTANSRQPLEPKAANASLELLGRNEPVLKVLPLPILDKRELAIARFERDARKNIIELRQVFVE